VSFELARLLAELASWFGLIALVLACIGLYGTMSFAVARGRMRSARAWPSAPAASKSSAATAFLPARRASGTDPQQPRFQLRWLYDTRRRL